MASFKLSDFNSINAELKLFIEFAAEVFNLIGNLCLGRNKKTIDKIKTL